MTGLEVAAIAMLAGTGMQMVAARQQGKAQQAAAEYNARMAEQNAVITRQQTAEEERRFRSENKKLIGIGSLANPVRKTENREFLFKLKLDI